MGRPYGHHQDICHSDIIPPELRMDTGTCAPNGGFDVGFSEFEENEIRYCEDAWAAEYERDPPTTFKESLKQLGEGIRNLATSVFPPRHIVQQLLKVIARGGIAVNWLMGLVDILKADIPNEMDRIAQVVVHVVMQLPSEPAGPNSTLPESNEILTLLPPFLLTVATSDNYEEALDKLLPDFGAKLEPTIGIDLMILVDALGIYRKDGALAVARFLSQKLFPPAIALLMSVLLGGGDAPDVLEDLLGLLDSGEFEMPIRAMMQDNAAQVVRPISTAARDAASNAARVQLVTVVTSTASEDISLARQTLDSVLSDVLFIHPEFGEIATKADAAWASDGPQGAVGVITAGLMTGSTFTRFFVRIISAGRPVLKWVQELATALGSGNNLDLLVALIGGVPDVPLLPQPPEFVRTLLPVMVALAQKDLKGAAEALQPVVVRLPCHATISAPALNHTLWVLLTTCYLLLTTYYSLLTTHYSLLTTHYSLLTTHYSLLTTDY